MLSESVRRRIHQALPPTLQQVKAQAGIFARYVRSRFAKIKQDPVFILGNQKSGTTVIAAALAHCADLSVTLDIRDLTANRLSGLYDGSVALETFINRYRRAFSRDVIKEPGLTFTYERFKDHFPNASFVLIVRDPRDNIRSILNRLDLPGDASSLPSGALADTNAIWRQIMKADALDIEADHYIEILARRWNRATNVYLQHAGHVHLAKYEDFCTDKREYIRSLVRRLGLSEKQSPIPVLEKQHQPRGNRSVSWEDFFGSENLVRIEQVCAENMISLEYPH